MTREIKFRAWVDDFAPDEGERKESVMFYSTKANTTHMIGDRGLVCCGGAKPQGTLNSFLENPRNPVMQYTGLKDKNGKEIYEGDVCQWPSGINREVVWDERNACFSSRDVMLMKEIGKIAVLGHHLEVIGNIYENSELLTPTHQ